MTGRRLFVSKASPADAKLMAALHEASFHETRAWEPKFMANFVTDPFSLCLIGVADEETPAGLLIARQTADEAELLTIGTRPAYRRQGVARTLLQHAVGALTARNVKQFFFEVDENNASALALYRAFGATHVGRRPGYYENGADAVILGLDLSALPFRS